MKARLYDQTGKEKGETELPADVFEAEVSQGVVYETLRIELMNRRQGTHKTKRIHELSGGGKKPWRQKGTGHARQGSTRAPQFRGGATIFGPQPQDHTLKIPAKKRRAGIRSMLAEKASKDAISILQEVTLSEFSTGAIYGIFKNMGMTGNRYRVAYLVKSDEEKLKKSAANIPGLYLMPAGRINAPELYYADKVVISEPALEMIREKYSRTSRKATGGAG